MAIFQNFSPFEVGEFAGHDHEGRPFYSVIVKATFVWTAEGEVRRADEQQPIIPADVYEGDPETSGPVLPSDLVPAKPLLDVVMAGRFELPASVSQVDVTLQVGTRVRKTTRLRAPFSMPFRAVAPFSKPRVRYAGTYDESWQEVRFPLLPTDFDERYFNCAPEDQQLPEYIVGEEVRLTYMSTRGHDRFALPEFEVPVRFVGPKGQMTPALVTPDTVVIEPADFRFTLSGRAKYLPKPDLGALKTVHVGEPTRGILRAMATGKRYVDPRAKRAS